MYVTFNDILKDATSKFRATSNSTDIVYEAIRLIEEASTLTRKGGLLALEDAFAMGNSKTLMDDIAFGVMMIVDGTEPEIVKEVFINDYWANKYEGNNALKQYILMRGLLSIQQGENPRIITQILISTLPRELRDECNTIIERSRANREKRNEKKIIEWYNSDEWEPIYKNNDIIKRELESLVADLSNKTSKQLLNFIMQVNTEYLTLLIALLDRDKHKILIDNMSRRLFILCLGDIKDTKINENYDEFKIIQVLREMKQI